MMQKYTINANSHSKNHAKLPNGSVLDKLTFNNKKLETKNLQNPLPVDQIDFELEFLRRSHVSAWVISWIKL